ncbi:MULTISPECIES: haloacid dehalogenase type II [Streptomyces]|uniref:Dehalogenase n=1 Tax=Streptomyces coelicolor (strain ATCC BAA-471 / A3(2) / M145) TaxID=100226 RepID=Q9RKI6_STRCO|nr:MULTISPECIES: haloacid dehalogenase type II [Streptomyces]MYU42970.1 haloacid dehalogenase type II [Streptomyces sp. SID7813]QOZ99026.1 haloacid dehalogenase type II [Streptomyces violascens]ESP99532.1 dehalogenase [Streptomyces sp. GBA 94-10 4N24]ESQ05580.1 dehalogenase [Streptomyces sp. PVA_94-07]MDX2928748.1 haloacid dehalogenase type II [Streptomyces sp. NRRL_B-16638]
MPRQNAPLLVFDVNETLSDMSPLQSRFAEIGAPPHLFHLWFAGVLRDGFALTAAGAFSDFSAVAREGVRALLSSAPEWSGDIEQAAGHVVDGLSHLEVHPDVPDGIRALRERGFRLVTMTNGSSDLSKRLLGRAGLADCFESHLDASGPQRWKPAQAAYQYVVEQVGVRLDEAVLVAVHPWDVDGAQRAGLGGAWLRRDAADYPQVMLPPTYTVGNLRELAETLA